MITIRIIPNVIDLTDRKEFKVKYINKITFAELLSENNIDIKKQIIICNGKLVSADSIIEDNSIIIITPDIRNGDTIAGIMTVGLIIAGFFTAGSTLWLLAGLTAVNWGLSKLATKPSYGKSGNEIDDSSPTYGWDGIQNTQDAGIPIPIIYGQNRIGGNIINMSIEPGGTEELVWSNAILNTDYSETSWSNISGWYTKTITTITALEQFKMRVYSIQDGNPNNLINKRTKISYKLTTSSVWTLIEDGYFDYKDILVDNLDNTKQYNIKIECEWVNGLYRYPYYSDFYFGSYQTVPGEFGDKINLLLGIGEGELEDISEVQIDDNPITNYQRYAISNNKGTNTQSALEPFDSRLNSFFSMEQNLLKDKSFTYKTYNNNINGFELSFLFPNGIWQTNDSGTYNQWAVQFTIEYKLSTASTWTTYGTITANYKTRKTYRKVVAVSGLAAGQYDIRITRISDDSDNQYKYGDLYLRNINEFISKELAYPNTALLSVSLTANEQISNNIPTITSLVKGLKIQCPSIKDSSNNEIAYDNYYYDEEDDTYKSLADDSALTIDKNTMVSKYCANPIWCLYDLLTNTRYGLGNYIVAADIDFDSFYEMAKYCDKKFSSESQNKLFRLDIVLDSSASILDLISTISQSFRGFVFFTAGKIKVVIDKPEPVTQVFTMGNIVSGTFKKTIKSLKDVGNVYEITFYDKDNNYKQDIVSVEDSESIAEIGIRKKTKRIFTNDESYAVRDGQFSLLQDKNINSVIAFNAAVDAVLCQPGDIIEVANDVDSFCKSGRIRSYSSGTITVDSDITLEVGKSYKIKIRLSDDTIIEKTILNEISEDTITRELEVEDTFETNPKNYDLYSVYESTEELNKYRFLTAKRNEDFEIELTAIEYNESIY